MIRKEYIASSTLAQYSFVFGVQQRLFGPFGKEEHLLRNVETDGSMLWKMTKARKLMQM